LPIVISPVVNFTHNVANGIPNAQNIASAHAIAKTPYKN
jgi:hypothetical protein